MAMQRSEELAETVSVLFKQLLGLGIRTEQIRTCGIVTFDEKEPIGEQWITETNGDIIPRSFKVPYNEAPAYIAIYEAWKRGEKFMINHLEGDLLKQHLGYLAKYTNVPVRDVVTPQQAKEIFNHLLFFSQGCLFIITKDPLTEYHDVFKRFGTVFQQSYTRFLDLQKAEAQTREAQIEAALEKVRSRSLAMHKTSELQEVVNLVFEKLQAMGIEMDSINISVPNGKTREQKMWIAVNGIPYPNSIILPDHNDPISQDGWKAWDSGLDLFCKAYSFDEKNEFFSWAFEHSDLKYMPSERKSWVLQREAYAYSLAIGKISVIQALNYSGKLLDAKENEILKRFAKVFEQAYIRFLDLEKAETQAREAQIEAALERVRSRTMAMQKSDELAQTAVVVFKQLIGLGIQPNRLFIGIIKDDSGDVELWATDEDGSRISTRFTGNVNRNQSINKMYKGWKAHKKSLTIDMHGQELKDYFRYLAEELKVPFKLGLLTKAKGATDHLLLTRLYRHGFTGTAA